MKRRKNHNRFLSQYLLHVIVLREIRKRRCISISHSDFTSIRSIFSNKSVQNIFYKNFLFCIHLSWVNQIVFFIYASLRSVYLHDQSC